jgi:hypothetical protein
LVKLSQHRRDVVFDGPGGQAQHLRDLGVAQSIAKQGEHFPLAGTQPVGAGGPRRAARNVAPLESAQACGGDVAHRPRAQAIEVRRSRRAS